MSSPEEKFSIAAAQLLGNFCETLFYGMYLVTCCTCAHTLLHTDNGQGQRSPRVGEIPWMMVSIALALFGISTFDVAIGLLHNFHAFIESSNPKKEFDNIRDWINIARSLNQVIVMLLGDFVLIYRCWIVHGRRWLVVVPSLVLYFGGISMAIKLIHVEVDPKTPPNITLNSEPFRPWWLSFFAITAFQNTLTTGILVWRIWRVDSRSSRYLSHSALKNQPRHLQIVIWTMAESGAVYTLMAILTFIVSVTESNALYPMGNMALQATGIAFNLILVRSSTGRDRQFTAFDQNERTPTVVDQRKARTRTIVSTANLSHHPHERGLGGAPPQDLEMNVKSIRSLGMDKRSETDIYPEHITVTKSVHTS